MLALLNLNQILDNPFRDTKRNPLNPEKTDVLVASINETGFWKTVVVRHAKGLVGLGHSEDLYELAFGHHRVAAARKAGLSEAYFQVEELSDAMMLKMMARENSESYGYNILSLLENVRSTVEALTSGSITSAIVNREESLKLTKAFSLGKKTEYDMWVPNDTPKASVLYSPSYVPGKKDFFQEIAEGLLQPKNLPYTATSLAMFLGRTCGKRKGVQAEDSIKAVLGALHLIELGIITESSVQDMSVDKLLGLVRDIKRRLADVEEHKQRALLDAKALQEKQSALDTQRREQEKKDRETEQARLRAVAAAKLEKDKAELAELEAEKKRNFERSQKRYADILEKRKVLDAQIEDNKQRQEAFKPKPEAEIRVQGVSALRFKFDVIYSESSGLVKESEVMGRNNNLTPEERETLRQAMLKGGERLRYGSEIFLPPGVARMATKALREKAAKGNAEKFFKSNKGGPI